MQYIYTSCTLGNWSTADRSGSLSAEVEMTWLSRYHAIKGQELYLHISILLDVTGTSDCFTSKLRVSTAMTPIGTPPSLPRPITTLLPQPGKYLSGGDWRASLRATRLICRLLFGVSKCLALDALATSCNFTSNWARMIRQFTSNDPRTCAFGIVNAEWCDDSQPGARMLFDLSDSLKVPSSKKPVSLPPSGVVVPAMPRPKDIQNILLDFLHLSEVVGKLKAFEISRLQFASLAFQHVPRIIRRLRRHEGDFSRHWVHGLKDGRYFGRCFWYIGP